MDIKDYRKAIRELLKESKEEANQTYTNRDGSTTKLTPTQMKHRVEYDKKQRDPKTRLKSGKVSDKLILQKRRAAKPSSRNSHVASRGVTHDVAPGRKNPESYKKDLKTKDRARKQTVDGKYPEKKIGGHKAPEGNNEAPKKQNEARKEAWLNAFESILLEFDPRHDTGRAKEVDANLAAATARETSLKKSRRANNAANRKAKKKGDNLSTPEQRKKWAEKEANRARQRVGGTTGQQHDNTLNPKSPELTRAEIKQRARKQRAKKGRKRMKNEARKEAWLDALGLLESLKKATRAPGQETKDDRKVIRTARMGAGDSTEVPRRRGRPGGTKGFDPHAEKARIKKKDPRWFGSMRRQAASTHAATGRKPYQDASPGSPGKKLKDIEQDARK